MFRFSVMVLVLGFISCSGEKGDSSSGGEPSVAGGASSASGDKGQEVQGGASLLASVLPSFSFRRIPKGTFVMGSPESEAGRDSDEAQVGVEITKPFEMMSKEVTQKQWFLVMRNNPSYFKGEEYCDNYDSVNKLCPDHPVERVSWNDVQEYIKKLNDLQGLKNCEGSPKDPSGCYRLPTEAEWEWAARAGTKTAYFFGNDASVLGKYAWYYENSGSRTHKVGTRAANSLGLHDVYGNVSEWVQDVYREELEEGEDPLYEGSLLSGSFRVVRGGSWLQHRALLALGFSRQQLPGLRELRCRVPPCEDIVTL